MALPKINTPHYKLKLPSDGRTITYRPYLVKEQKILLMASQAGTFNDAYTAIKQIAANCTLNAIDIDTLPLFDLEYLFLNIRAKSVGEIITPTIKCDKCQADVNVTLNLNEIKVTEMPDRNIKLSNGIGIVFNYPTFDISKLEARPEDINTDFEAIYSCLDYIYENDQHYSKKDFTLQEFISDFLECLSDTDYQMLVDFFARMPVIYLDCDVVCKCGNKKTIRVSGAQDFL